MKLMGKVVVVGGGAAGMMAAVAAANRGHSVLLLEKNEKLGKKIFITGKGRCNVTNACDIQELFDSVISNPRFLYSAIYGFDNTAVQDFFEKRGCRLKVERGNRVFPVSDHSSDIIRTLSDELKHCGVQVRLFTEVKRILTEVRSADVPVENVQAADVQPADSGKTQVTGVLLANGETIRADAVILCCGGMSYQATGSTGDGYRMAQELGHSLVPCMPSLVPFLAREEWCRQLQGLALKNVNAALYIEGKEIYSGFGEMLFTHFGVSGPLILTASCYYQEACAKIRDKAAKKAAKGKAAENGATGQNNGAPGRPEAVLYLDLKPALTEEQLDKRVLRDFEEHKNKQFKNALDGLFPSRLIPVMIQQSGIDPEKKVNEITREERKAFVDCIKKLPVHIVGTRGFEEAIITRGGIKVKEVNPSTMESRLVDGLYMAGEMLDLDALTGGFNLQIAWSTGYLAGDSVKL